MYWIDFRTFLEVTGISVPYLLKICILNLKNKTLQCFLSNLDQSWKLARDILVGEANFIFSQ